MPGKRRTRRGRGLARVGLQAGSYRARALVLVVILAFATVAACRSNLSASRTRVIDFVKSFETAEARPARALFQADQHTLGGVTRASIAAPVPGRAIWSTRLPRHGVLHAHAGLLPGAEPSTVRFRIGISDHRIYEHLAELTLVSEPDRASAWSAMSVDLSRYAGRKFSIFYRPDSVVWRLVFSTDQIEGRPAAALWGDPGVETDEPAAREFIQHRVAALRNQR